MVAATSGIIGLAAFAITVFLLVRIEPLLLKLFIFPAMTNSLLFAPQHVTAMMLLAGILAWRKVHQGRSKELVGA
jgi:hypothetical protein